MDNFRIIVVSDTHGSFHALYEIVTKRMDEATCFIHLGDGCREIEDIRDAFPDLKLYSVRGNCDYGIDVPNVNEISVGGKKILFAHGHTQGVKYSLSQLCSTARGNGADIVLYGHTHQAYTGYEDGLYIMNPGSPVQPRDSKAGYGVIDITRAGIVLNLVSI